MEKLIVSLSPHDHANDSVQRNMYAVLIALIPAFLWSLLVFGIGALIVTLTSVVACVFFEWAIVKYILKRERTTILDGSAAITGVLLGFNLPSNLPIWIILLGALFAIGVAKMSFGGLGCNPFNPAIVGRIFLLISFPVQMTTWPQSQQWLSYIDVETGATPLAYMKQAIAGNPDALANIPPIEGLLLGLPLWCTDGVGSLGEICPIALLLGGAYLLWKKVITWHIPVSIIATVFVFTGIMHLANPTVYADPLAHVLTGGLLLGAFFMATDYVTSPMNPKGQLIYGVCIGLITVIIRLFGSYPEGMSFAILIMNSFTPLINNYIKPTRFSRRAVKK